MHALDGDNGVLRLAGFCGRERATFLLDSGASAEFLSVAFAREQGLVVQPCKRSIRLADGTLTQAVGTTTVRCTTVCRSRRGST